MITLVLSKTLVPEVFTTVIVQEGYLEGQVLDNDSGTGPVVIPGIAVGNLAGCKIL